MHLDNSTNQIEIHHRSDSKTCQTVCIRKNGSSKVKNSIFSFKPVPAFDDASFSSEGQMLIQERACSNQSHGHQAFLYRHTRLPTPGFKLDACVLERSGTQSANIVPP